MPIMKKLGCLAGITAILALSVAAEARQLSNMLASNMLASNMLASNMLASNMLAGNMLASNPAGVGVFTDVNVIEFPNGIRFTR